MKKITAISLLVLFLFNLVGYQVFFYFAQKQADTHLEASLDNNNYNEKDLITIKVPLLMPYQTSSSSFERVDGEVSFNGKIYKYVKRKITNGELVLLCLPNEHKMHLQSAKEEYFKFSNDIQNSASKKSGAANTHVFKSSLSEFDQQHSIDVLHAFAVNKPLHKIPSDISSLITRSHSSPEQPPEPTANV